MTTFSTSLKLELIGDGQQSGTWGSTTNKNLGTLLEQAITGVETITMLDANYTLSNLNGVSDEARNAVIIATGTNSGIKDIIAPLVNKQYWISNQTTGGYAIRVRGASGLSVTIPNGIIAPVYCDSTNFYSLIDGTVGDFTVTGNETVGGTLGVTGQFSGSSAVLSGALTGTTATFSGSISSVSPAFTGAPTAPTASPGTSTTQIATTAFVSTAVASGVPSGCILMWSGSIGSIPSGWRLCDGTSGTPDLRNKFIVGAGSTYAVNATGGSADAIVVSHTHSVSDPGHSHSIDIQSNGVGSGPGSTVSFGGSRGTSTSGTGISISSAGSSGTNANLPPYLALAYIMKI